MSVKNNFLLALVVFALLPGSSALAQSGDNGGGDNGFYLGVEGGQSSYFSSSDVCGELMSAASEAASGRFGNKPLFDETFAATINGTQCGASTNTTAFGFFAGYRFNRFVAIEGAYHDFGEASASLSSNLSQPVGTLQGSGSVTASLNGFSFSTLLFAPIGTTFSVYGRLGALVWNADAMGTASGNITNTNGSITPTSVSYTLSKSGYDLRYGGGIRVRLSERIALRAEWSRYEVVDLQVIGAGLEISLK